MVLISRHKIGEIFCYDLSSNQILSSTKFFDEEISGIIETEDNQIILSSSRDVTLKICTYI